MNHAIIAPITPATTAAISQLFEPDDAPAAPPTALAIAVINNLLLFSFIKGIKHRHIKRFAEINKLEIIS